MLIVLNTLRGQYEAITGETEVVFCKQQHFREIWRKAKVFTSFGGRIKWRYAPPGWLFPRPILEGPWMRAFATWHVGWGGYEGFILLYEFFVAFGHRSINTKVNFKKRKHYSIFWSIWCGQACGDFDATSKPPGQELESISESGTRL